MDETTENNKEYRWQGSYQQNGPKNLLNDHQKNYRRMESMFRQK